MINSRELMRGNLVLFSEDSTLFEVTEIGEKGLGVKNEKEETWIEVDQFEPIQITEDWLRRFEFEEYNSGSEYFKNFFLTNNRFGISLCLLSNEIHKEGVYYWGEDGIKFQYIHQLQNWYFQLSGEELQLQ